MLPTRRLNCLIAGENIVFTVIAVGDDDNVSNLKKFIQSERAQGSLKDVDPHTLELWKVKDSHSITAKPEDSLVERIGLLGHDLSKFADKLEAVDSVFSIFPQQPHRDYIHIIVKVPCTFPKKRSGSPGEGYGRPMKSKKIDTADCAALHNAIKSMPNMDLANPETFTLLPFPSLLPVPFQRFEAEKIEAIFHFQYMGRKKFKNLKDYLQNPNFLNKHGCLYVYGSSGSGKSHLLAALVYHLIREGERVFYIPDCYKLLQAPAQTIWGALRFACHDLPILGSIENVDDVDELMRFVSAQESVYIIVDQINALEVEKFNQEVRIKISGWLEALRFGHYYIFSASPNEVSNREASRKQSGIIIFRMFGGMDRDETTQWFIHHQAKLPQLSHEQREVVEYITGCDLLLLRNLFGLNEFEEVNFRNLTDLYNVKFNIEDFFQTKYKSLREKERKAYLRAMKACIQGLPLEGDVYDLRYFYPGDNHIGQFTCGIAFETMMLILQIDRGIPRFGDHSWYDSISKSSNPVVRGFLAEQVCLHTISKNGLALPSVRLGPMASDHTAGLFIPSAYNFKTVDGVILKVDRGRKEATIFSIQFTLSSRHKQSDKQFHRELWWKWIEQLTSAQYQVVSTFVWIDKAQPSNQVEAPLVKELKSGTKVVHPGYSVVHIGVETVDGWLATALGI